MSGKKIGYIRVSTTDQNPDRQLEGIELDKKFIDFASARSTDRPQFKAMMDYVRDGDIVIVHSMDRLARNLGDLRSIVKELVSQNVQVQFVKENLVFNGLDNAMSTLMLSLMGAFAEFEYDFIRERQREGIEIAKRMGIYKGGKPTKLDKELKEKIKIGIEQGKPKTRIAKELGISCSSLYRYLENMNK